MFCIGITLHHKVNRLKGECPIWAPWGVTLSYRLQDHAAIAGKEDKNKKTKSKSNEPSTAEPAS
jgi:hypothetical protein